jgi:UDP-glucuronate 4-epimerase
MPPSPISHLPSSTKPAAPVTSRLRLLVTGAAGFVGWKTCELLLEAGHTVVGLDNLNDYYDIRLKQWRRDQLLPSPDFTFIEADLEDAAALRRLFERFAQVGTADAARGQPPFDAVVNLGARAGVRASIEDPLVYYTTNVLGSLHLLELIREYQVPKYVLASTSSLYAGHPLPFAEDAPVNAPISPYAASKKAAEAMAYTWHHLHGIDVSVVRYFTVYGPAGRPDMSPLRFLRWIDEGTPLTLYGDGTQTRDFTYIDDIARGTIAALRPLGFEILNLGGGNRPVSIREMIDHFARALGKQPLIDEQPFHAADMKDTAAVIDKARTLLDWQPRVPPEEGFQHTVDWYVQHRDLVKSLVL